MTALSDKQLFVLTSEQLCAWDWRDGRLSASARFSVDSAGLDAFAGHLASRPGVPAYLLADLIEEDFQRQSLPHVRGKAGRQLIERKLNQLQRDTPYRRASIEGRAVDGRRDDLVLFCALTNPALLQPWLATLERWAIPLAGLYSSSLLAQPLAATLGLQQPHLLLVVEQAGGLRQSYIEQGKLRFSRLTPALERDGRGVSIAAETEKTRQFLTSTRMLERGDVLHTAIIAPQHAIAALQALCQDSVEVAYQFITLDDAAERLRIEPAPALADPLLLTLLARRPPASHYPLGARRRFYQLWRARVGLYGAAAASAAVALLWLGFNLWTGIALSLDTTRLQAAARIDDNRYQAIMATLPPSLAPAHDMKSAVLLERFIRGQAPTPEALTSMLSQALERNPQVRLTSLTWQAGGKDGPVALSLAAGQSLRVEGDVTLLQDDYRAALGSVGALVRDLAAMPGLTVEVLETPLDLRPGVKLSGKASGTESSDDAAGSQARFVLNLTWRP